MAVKFSDFTQKQDASVAVTNMVGYLAAGELNIMIPPANLDTTYVVSTKNAGASPTINIQGTKPGQTAVINPSTVSLTGSGGTLLAGDGSTTIDFASTAYALTSTNTSPAGTVPLVLTGTGGGDAGTDTVNLVGTGTIGITSSGNTITINGTGGGGAVTSFNQVVGALSTGTALTAGGTGAGPFTGAVTIASNIYNGTTNVGIVPTGGSNTTFLRGDGQWITPAGGGSGTVTSVGLTETGTALTITSDTANPIVGTGTFNIAGAGTSSQVILGDLSLATLPTDTNTTYTVDVPTGTTSINLKSSDAVDDAIVLVGGTDIGLVRDSANQITINSQAVGGVTSVDETTPGISAGTPIVVNPTTGTVLVQSMAFDGAAKVGHVPSSAAAGQTTDFLRADGTWATPASAAPTKTVDQVTIANATTGTVSLTVSPTSEAYTDMYVSGVYQNKSVYSLSGSTITLDSSAYFPNGAIVEVVSTT
jgi:hypothetical protein